MKFGALVVDGRGKIGGHVASKNRGGAYLRTKVTPVNRNTAEQLSARSRLSNIAQSWRGLTSAQISAWNSAVNAFKSTNIFGDIKTPSGFNLYQKINNNLSQISESLLTDPPSLISLPVLEGISLTGVFSTSLTMSFLPDPVPAGVSLVYDATSGLSAGVSFVKSEYRRLGYLPSATAGAEIITTPYINVFGSVPATGLQVFLRARMIDVATGISGPFTYTKVTL